LSHDVPMPLSLPDRLETDRLFMRPYSTEDAIAYHAACLRNREHLHPFEHGNPALDVRTVEDTAALIRGFADDYTARKCLFLGAWDRCDGQFVAQVYVGVTSWTPPRFELGYWVDLAHEGRGYVTEAARAVLGWLFDVQGAEEVRIGCNELNVRSQRVAERIGLVRIAHHPHTRSHIRLPDGTASGDYEYSLSRADHEQSRATA
jgi:RimJ/RimL family protein N-acetyltransferase